MGSSPKNLFGRISGKIKSIFHLRKSWKDIEYFNDNWKDRVAYMSMYIDAGSSVMDLGCGKMWLREYMPLQSKYIPVDYCKRSEDTLVANFNKHQYPEINVDTSFISGCLEYINDYEWFLMTIAQHTKRKIILSYCSMENQPDLKKRKELYWVNHLRTSDIEAILKDAGYTVADRSQFNQNSILVFIQ